MLACANMSNSTRSSFTLNRLILVFTAMSLQPYTLSVGETFETQREARAALLQHLCDRNQPYWAKKCDRIRSSYYCLLRKGGDNSCKFHCRIALQTTTKRYRITIL